MALLLLIILIVSEIGFIVFELMKKPVKSEFAKMRLFANISQLLIFFLMLLLPGIDLSFRFKGLLFILIVRILVSAVIFLIQGKNEKAESDKAKSEKAEGENAESVKAEGERVKNKKTKKKVMIVLSGVLSVLLISTNMIPAFVFADYKGRAVTGEYTVGQKKAIFIDPSRTETFENDNSCREVPVYFYYPEELTENEKGKNSLPLVVFSHGAFGYYQSNSSTYMELASHGYIVVSLDHPYHSFFTKDSSGKTITVNPEFIQTALAIGGDTDSGLSAEETWNVTSEWIKLRMDDMNFVLDTLKEGADGKFTDAWFYPEDSEDDIAKIVSCIDTKRIGLIGHSLGGATAVSVGRRDDVKAVVDLDGTMIGEETGVENGVVIINEDAYTTPLLCIDNEEHYMDREKAEKGGYNYANNVILNNATDGYVTYFKGAEHMNYTDLPLFSPFLAGMLGTGDVDAAECIDRMNAIVLNFFDCYLKDAGTFEVSESY